MYLKWINKVRNFLLKNTVEYLFVTAPENVAWILNIRGYDPDFSPIPNARLLINKKGNIDLFSQSRKLVKIKKKLSKKIKFHHEYKIEYLLAH